MRRRTLPFVLALLFAAAPLGAEAPPGDEDRLAVVPPTVPVMLDDTQLFEVYGIKDFPAEVRAARIQQRLEKVADDRRVRPEHQLSLFERRDGDDRNRDEHGLGRHGQAHVDGQDLQVGS